MKEELKDYSKDILTTLEVVFNGISHAVHDKKEQHVYILTDTNRAASHPDGKPSGRVRIKDNIKFREILVGFFSVIQKGLRYQPDGDATEKAKSQFDSLIKQSRSPDALIDFEAPGQRSH